MDEDVIHKIFTFFKLNQLRECGPITCEMGYSDPSSQLRGEPWTMAERDGYLEVSTVSSGAEFHQPKPGSELFSRVEGDVKPATVGITLSAPRFQVSVRVKRGRTLERPPGSQVKDEVVRFKRVTFARAGELASGVRVRGDLLVADVEEELCKTAIN